jgi:hypothetical protein
MPALRDKALYGVLCTFNTRASKPAAGYARISQMSSPRQGQAVRCVKAGGTDRPSRKKSHPAAWVTLLQPARRAAVLGQPSSLRPLGRLSKSPTHSEMSRILFKDFTRRFPNSPIKSTRFKYTLKEFAELAFL